MTEYEVYCPAMKRMVKIEGNLKPIQKFIAILSLHPEQCLFESSCPKKDDPHCLLHKDIQGKW